MEHLFDLLEESVSAYHTVAASEKRLVKDGFVKLSMAENWSLEKGGRYYVIHRDSSLFAFTVGEDMDRDIPVRIAAAHTDFPGLYIKAQPDVKKVGCLQLNVEVYGGAILSTWMDRPLSVAGKVVLKSQNVMKPEVRLVNLKEPVCTIPNLAIHMNREVNKGVELNRQNHMMPIVGLANELNENQSFAKFLAQHMEVEPEDILDFDLYLYSAEKPCYVGMNQEMISASHLDNTTGILALLEGIMGESAKKGLNVVAMFDNEEIGSRTPKGAASIVLLNLLKKILRSLDLSEDILYESMVLSVDVAHAVHPNYMEKADPVLQPKLGGGFCIKEACAQSYATDSSVVAVVQQICQADQIPYQMFANNSSIPGGGTLGNISSVFLPVAIADIGIPILAMHSIRELMGAADMASLSGCVRGFFHK